MMAPSGIVILILFLGKIQCSLYIYLFCFLITPLSHPYVSTPRMLTSGCWPNKELRAHSASSHCCLQTWILASLSQHSPAQEAISGKNKLQQQWLEAGHTPVHTLPQADTERLQNRKRPWSNLQRRAQKWLVQGLMAAQLASKSSPIASLTSLWGVNADFHQPVERYSS